MTKVSKDQEKVAKAAQCADLLVRDLKELVAGDNPLLCDIALDMLQVVVPLQIRLSRILKLLSMDNLDGDH